MERVGDGLQGGEKAGIPEDGRSDRMFASASDGSDPSSTHDAGRPAGMVSPLRQRAVDSSQPLLDHLAALPVAIVETDGEGMIRTWAGAAERLFGWSADEVLGTDIDALDLVHEADVAFVDAILDRLRA